MILHCTTSTNKNKPFGNISNRDLLQANATVIAGTLIFITISSIGEVTAPYLLALVAGILLPFSLSSIIIISERRLSVSGYPVEKGVSMIGFAYLLVAVSALAYVQTYPPAYPITTPAEKCAIHPQGYNVTHAADCSKFSTGSLAGDCALHPEKFNVNLKQCANFIEK